MHFFAVMGCTDGTGIQQSSPCAILDACELLCVASEQDRLEELEWGVTDVVCSIEAEVGRNCGSYADCFTVCPSELYAYLGSL